MKIIYEQSDEIRELIWFNLIGLEPCPECSELDIEFCVVTENLEVTRSFVRCHGCGFKVPTDTTVAHHRMLEIWNADVAHKEPRNNDKDAVLPKS